jgi:hypothetical protein
MKFLRDVQANLRSLVDEIESGLSPAQLAAVDQRHALIKERHERRLLAADALLRAFNERPLQDFGPADLTDEEFRLLGEFCEAADSVRRNYEGVKSPSMTFFGTAVACGSCDADTFLRELARDRNAEDVAAMRLLFDIGIAAHAREVYRAALAAREGRARG